MMLSSLLLLDFPPGFTCYVSIIIFERGIVHLNFTKKAFKNFFHFYSIHRMQKLMGICYGHGHDAQAIIW